jgi:hypothetical protein
MAISAPHYRLLKSLKPILPVGGTLLEIGEANWYGDIEPDFPCGDTDPFAIAKAFYAVTFAPSKIVSIDMGGTPAALRLDLNHPLPSGHDRTNRKCPGYAGFEALRREGKEGFACACPGQPLGEPFDVSINHGTAEHIFNIAQVFRTMHDHTVDGGLMVHESPCTGWIDHGFYCLQPTLFYDLAAANCYEIVMVALEHIDSNWAHRLESRDELTRLEVPNNSMLFVVFRKRGEGPFKIPMQGYYTRSLSEAGMKAWETRR